MKVLRIVLAVVALALALFAVLVAVDVGRWHDRIGADDRSAAQAPLAPIGYAPSTIVPFDPARTLLGVDDDVALRRAIRAFVVARHTGEGFDNGDERSRRVEAAQAALEQVVLTGSPRQVSSADVLLGVLEFSTASAPPGVADPAEQSANAFTEAARLDPSNAAAKFDLELVLRVLAPVGTRPGSNPSAGDKGHGTHGAGAGLPGSGF